MHFYIDETGQTGYTLFDKDQPMLYYGVVSCEVDIDVVAERHFIAMREKLGVKKLHATELGNGPLLQILPELLDLQQTLGFKFAVHRLWKPDHAAIDFFSEVLDCRWNPAMPKSIWMSPDRYLLLMLLRVYVFDEDISKAAWAMRQNTNSRTAQTQLKEVCSALVSRLDQIPVEGIQPIFKRALQWASDHPAAIAYNGCVKSELLDAAPNLLCFQLVMHGIAARVAESGMKAQRIVVDHQMEFNAGQRTLAEFYASSAASEIEWGLVPEAGPMDLKNIPDVPLEFPANSCGVEIADIYLWLLRRAHEEKTVAPALLQLLNFQPILMDQISVQAMFNRWRPYFDSGKSTLMHNLGLVQRGRPVET